MSAAIKFAGATETIMETNNHQQPCACGNCREQRRNAALDVAKEQPEARRSAAACSPRELASKIATCLFTNGVGHKGTRLEIKSGTKGRHSERSFGGWCLQSAVDQIEKALLEENVKVHTPLPASASVETGVKP